MGVTYVQDLNCICFSCGHILCLFQKSMPLMIVGWNIWCVSIKYFSLDFHCPASAVLSPLPLALSLGCYGEQQGGGACSGSDGRRRGGRGEVVRRMRRSNRRPLPALLHGAVLAHTMPEVLLLPCSAGRVQQHLLQQRRHDPLQERLHQVGPDGLSRQLSLKCQKRVETVQHNFFNFFKGDVFSLFFSFLSNQQSKNTKIFTLLSDRYCQSSQVRS